MPFELIVNVAGEEQVRRSFSRFAEDVQDASEAFEEIAKDFKELEAQQFDSEGATGSGGWKPLSSSYASWKAKWYPGAKLLVLSGLMKESLAGENPWTIKEVSPLSMRLGTRIPYAFHHQTGTSRMLARPLIQLTEADKTRWTKIFHLWLLRQSRKEFAGLMPDIKRGQQAVGGI